MDHLQRIQEIYQRLDDIDKRVDAEREVVRQSLKERYRIYDEIREMMDNGEVVEIPHDGEVITITKGRKTPTGDGHLSITSTRAERETLHFGDDISEHKVRRQK